MFLKSEGLSAAKFADKMDVGAANISHLLSGRNKPGFDFIAKMLERFPALNPDWLLLGSGQMYRQLPQTPVTASSEESARQFLQSPPVEEQLEANPAARADVEQHKSMPDIKKVVILYDDRTFEFFDPRMQGQ